MSAAAAKRQGLVSLVWLVSEKLLQLAFSALAVGLIARTLGVETFGEFQYVLAVLFIFSSIGLLAGGEVAAPKLAQADAPAARRALLGSLFVVRLGMGVLAALAMLIWATLTADAARFPLLAVLAVSLAVAEPFNVLRLTREVAQQTRVITSTRLASSCVKLAVIYLLFRLDAPILAFVLVYSIEYFLVAACYLLTIRQDGWPWQWRMQADWARYFLTKGGVVWLGILGMMLLQRLDRIVLSETLNADIYGQYTAAMSLLDSAWFFGPVAVAALAPSMVYRAPDSRQRRRFPLLLGGLGVAGALGILIFSPWVVPLIFGAKFDTSVRMLQTSGLILIPGFLALSLDALLIQGGGHRAVAAKWLAGLAACAATLYADLGLSWEQGPLAIAIGYSVSLCLGLLLLWRAASAPPTDTEHP